MPNDNTSQDQNQETVSPDTDNLDDFSKLLEGTAQPAEEAEDEATVEEEVVEQEDQDDTDDDEGGESGEPEVDDPAPEADDETDDEEEEETPEPRNKGKQTARERINELTAERRAAEREAANERVKNEQLEARLAALEAANKPQEEDKAPETLVKPRHDAEDKDGSPIYPLGEFDPDFVTDLTRFENEKWRAEYEAENKQTQEEQTRQAEIEARATAWEGQVAKASETNEDFVEKVTELEETFSSVSPEQGAVIANTIMAMEDGTDVLYHLANNHDVAAEIASADPLNAALKLGEVRAAVKRGKTSPASKRTTKAKAPPKSVKGVTSSRQIQPDTDNLDDFETLLYAKG